MSSPAKRQAAYEDLFDLPENLVGEIIAGELHTHPRPAPKHARAYSALGGSIGIPYDFGNEGPGGWWIIDEPELHPGGYILVPDLAGWRREHMATLPENAWFELPPDWVWGILPPTARVDRILKMPLYAREEVPHLWPVDPDLRTLEVYRLNSDRHWTLLATLKDDDPISQPPFDATEFSLEVLWG